MSIIQTHHTNTADQQTKIGRTIAQAQLSKENNTFRIGVSYSKQSVRESNAAFKAAKELQGNK